MNGVLGHICGHSSLTGRGEPPEDGEVKQIAIPSKHMI